MDHRLSEFQELLRQTARDFFEREYPLDRMREMHSTPDGYDQRLWEAIGSLGWNSAPFPEEIGGVNGSFLDAAVLLEEMGRAACVSPYNHSTIACGLALAAVAKDLAVSIAEGKSVIIPALVVLPGDNASSIVTESGQQGQGRLTGRFVVPWANLATHFLVSANGNDAVMIGADQPAVSFQRVATSGGDYLFDLHLNGAQGDIIKGVNVRDDVMALGAAANALLMLGLCERALEVAVAYAKERIQFGRPIGSFQAIQHKSANMLIEVELGRYLAYKAAWLHAKNRPFTMAAHYAKSYFNDVTMRVTREAIQIHGGVGITDNHKVQLFYRIGAATAAAYGTAHEHRNAIAAAILDDRAA